MQVVKTDKPLSVFRGIPYAAPPVGDLRWKPPQPVSPWSGIRECTAGNPSLKGLIDWPVYQKAADKYLYITESLEVKAGFCRIAQK